MLKHDARCYDDDMRLKIPFLLWLVTIYGIRHGPFIAMTANVISLGLTPYSWLELQTNYYLIACDVPALLVLIAIIYRAPESGNWYAGYGCMDGACLSVLLCSE